MRSSPPKTASSLGPLWIRAAASAETKHFSLYSHQRADIKHGSLSLTVADHVAPHERAGKLNPDEIQRLPKAPRDIGGICEDTAALLEDSPGALPLPAHITPESLRLAARSADDTDAVIAELEYMLALFKQSNLLYDAEAWKLLREVNDTIQIRGKHDPDVLNRFAPVIRYFKRRHTTQANTSAETPKNTSDDA